MNILESGTPFKVITPSDAQDIIDLVNHEKQDKLQRNVNYHQINFLASEMTQGKFMPTTTIHLMECDGVYYLVNGQHTLLAIIESGVSVKVGYTVEKGHKLQDIHRTYAAYDKQRRRNLSDTFRAMGLYDRTMLNNREVGYLASTLKYFSYWITGRQVRYISDDSVLEEVEKWTLTYELFNLDVVSAKSEIFKSLSRRSTLWIALFTYHYKPQASKIFWEKVFTGEMLKADDPRFRLFNFLTMYKMTGGGNVDTRIKTDFDFTQTAIYCWNKWNEGRYISTMRLPSEKLYPFGVPVNDIFESLAFR